MSRRRDANGNGPPLPPLVAAVLERPSLPPSRERVPETTLFGLCDTGELHSSGDQGQTWAAHSLLPEYDAVALAACRNRSELLLASRGGLVHRSTDAGIEWTAMGAVPAGDVVALALQRDLSLVLLTASGVVYHSLDQGISFATWAALGDAEFVGLTAFDDGRLYALARTGELAGSTDGGRGWTYRCPPVGAHATLLCSAGEDLYVVTASGHVHRSRDAAATWSRVAVLPRTSPAALVCDRGTLIVAYPDGTVTASPDGSLWRWQGAIGRPGVIALATDSPAARGNEGSPPRCG